ncbi:hypothetical protein [Paraglaciecola sp. 25GB23A]|jgi:hypothetical protein|uniref:hypothetical protein n=1 Tax=Paraglaciecola sp. 25GB23A TaxID=3156068 RepID=UPI0032AF52DD
MKVSIILLFVLFFVQLRAETEPELISNAQIYYSGWSSTTIIPKTYDSLKKSNDYILNISRRAIVERILQRLNLLEWVDQNGNVNDIDCRLLIEFGNAKKSLVKRFISSGANIYEVGENDVILRKAAINETFRSEFDLTSRLFN